MGLPGYIKHMSPSRSTGVVIASVVMLAGLGVAAPTTASADSAGSAVKQAMRATALGSVKSVYVSSVDTGEKSVSVKGIKPMIPASTMKLITAFAAVKTLGADYRFTTKVVRGNTPRSIVLVGGADPVLTRADIAKLAQRTKAGLTRAGLTGTVTVNFDDDMFVAPTSAPGWEAGDMPTYISAVRPLTILGSYSADTARAAAVVFVDALNDQGVSAGVGQRISAASNAERLGRFRGNDVAEAIRVLLPVSENNVAELLFRLVAKKVTGKSTWAAGSKAARSLLKAEGVWVKGVRVVDGSGLSYDNRLTARTLTETLVLVATEPELVSIRNALPVAAESGTLRNRFGQPPASCAQGEIIAKTGSLPMTVSTLAGITTSPNAPSRVFAVLVNNRPSSQTWSATSAAIDAVAAAVHGCSR